MRKLNKMILGLGFVGSLALAGCGGGATCESATENRMKIMLKDVPEEMKKQLQGQKAELVKKCKQEKPSRAQLECATKAKSLEDIEKCDTK